MKDLTETIVSSYPLCDLCGEDEAHYDTRMKHGEAWANMCDDCFIRHGEGLGTGKGQKLVLKGRQKQEIRELIAQADAICERMEVIARKEQRLSRELAEAIYLYQQQLHAQFSKVEEALTKYEV